MKKILIPLILLCFCPFAFAQKKQAPQPVPNILIFNFDTKASEENYGYYSFIIPNAIAKNISESKKYSVNKIKLTPEFDEGLKTEAGMKEYLVKLRKQVKESEKKDYRADYIITGSFEVRDEKQLEITIRIFNLEGRSAEIIGIQDEANKAILKATVEDITEKIYAQIAAFSEDNKKTTASPFLPLYKFNSIFSFGMEGGYIFLLPPWTGVYDNPPYMRPNLTVHIGNYFGISANLLFINAGKWTSTQSLNTTMLVWAPSLDLHFFLNLVKYLHISVSAGAGFAYSHLTIYDMSNYSSAYINPLLDRISYDFYLDTSLSIGVNLGPVTLRAGGSYKAVFFMNTPMHMISVFGAFQYRI